MEQKMSTDSKLLAEQRWKRIVAKAINDTEDALILFSAASDPKAKFAAAQLVNQSFWVFCTTPFSSRAQSSFLGGISESGGAGDWFCSRWLDLTMKDCKYADLSGRIPEERRQHAESVRAAVVSCYKSLRQGVYNNFSSLTAARSAPVFLSSERRAEANKDRSSVDVSDSASNELRLRTP